MCQIRRMERFLVLLVCVVPAVQCYSSGEVTASCSSMLPAHPGTGPQNTLSPFSVTTDNTTYKEGDRITVRLEVLDSTPFKGFMLQAREVGRQTPLGSFRVTGPAGQLLTCNQSPNSAVSHTSADEKKLVQATWTAEVSQDPKPIEFSATFVQDFATFWVEVRSPSLTYSGASTKPPSIGTTASTFSVPSAATSLTISSAGCGVTKVCFSQPPNCNPAVDSGCYFMSALTTSPSGAAVHFEMTGPSQGYVSFGFSDDQQMGNDDIYICVVDSKGFVHVQHAFSTGREEPTTLPLGNVSDVVGSLQDGLISCSFTSRNPISTQRTSGHDQPYFLLFAYGPASNGEVSYHTGRFVSDNKVDISNPQLVGRGLPKSIKAHGALMLIAWMTTAALGMLISRYFRSVAKGHSYWGKSVWFLVHVALMSITVGTTIIAFIIIFSHVRGWSGGAHPSVGVSVMILALIQPLGAMFRCGPDHRLRYLFNWVHLVNGIVTKVLAVTAIFTGLNLIDSSDANWLTIVMAGCVAWEDCFYILFELYVRCKHKVLDYHDPDTENVKLSLLATFFLGNLGFLVALLVGIGKS